MDCCTRSVRRLTASHGAPLLGLLVREFEQLARDQKWAHYEEDLSLIWYAGDQIKHWALQHVHAPIPWFERFELDDISMVKRSLIVKAGQYYALGKNEELRMLREVADRCTADKVAGGVCRIYREDSPAFN